MAVAVGKFFLSISKTIAFRPGSSKKRTIEVLPALVEWIDRHDDVPIGDAIPVPGGFANDFGIWKTVIELYFREFMGFFFPQIAADIDWERGFVLMDKELQKSYNYWLRDRYDCPVASLAILADESPTWRPRSYQDSISGYEA